MSKRPPIIWAVSDGRAGIERQAIALANAIIDHVGGSLQIVRLTPKGAQMMLPPNMWPDPIGALPSEQKAFFEGEGPDIWIANGRRSIAYSLWVKKHFPKVLTAQIQNPKIPSKNFDYVVAPKHDQVKGDNVFETLGGLVYYSDAEITAARAQFSARTTGNRYLVILGGNSKTHKFTQKNALEILEYLKGLSQKDTSLWITTSRRTPPEISSQFRAFAAANKFMFFENQEKDGPNSYLSWLCHATHAIITEDSANMLADAAFFRLPITLIKLEGGSKKFDRLHRSFVDCGAAKWVEGNPKPWNYENPNDVNKIASAIVSDWQTRQIS